MRLEGIVYTVSIQGLDVVKGVGRDFPVIEGYTEQTVKLTATANLLASIRLVMDLMNTPGQDLGYEFEARLDTGGIGRDIRARESGSFRINSNYLLREPGQSFSQHRLEDRRLAGL